MNNVWLGNAQIKVELSTRTAKLMEGMEPAGQRDVYNFMVF